MARPLAWFGFGALFALLFGIFYLPSAAVMPLAVLLLVAAVVVLLLRRLKKKTVSSVVWLLFAVSLALLRLFAQQRAITDAQKWIDGQYHTVEGAVYDRYDGLYENVYTVELRVTSLDGTACRPFKVVCPNTERGEIGEVLHLRVQLEDHSKAYRTSWYAKGIYLRAVQEYAGGEIVLGEGKGVLLSMAKLRTELGGYFMILGRSTGGTAAAMVTGDRNRVDPYVRSQFQLAGVSHILVVSGLHLSLIAAMAGAVCRRLFRNRGIAVLGTLLCVFAYMLLVGMTVSVVRAGVLVVLALVAPLLDRTADSYNSLGLALILLLAFNPYAACDLGLLLSFAATLGVLCFGVLNARHFHFSSVKYIGKLLANLGVALFATLFTLPVLAWNGTTVSLGTLAANLLCVPLVMPVMIIGAVFLASHLLTGSPHMMLTGRLLYLLLRLMEQLIVWLNRVFSYRIGVSGWAAVAILCSTGLVIWVLYHSRLRRWCAAVGVAVCVALSAAAVALNVGTVKMALVGGGINPPVVISNNRECVVLYRGARSGLEDVEEYLQRNNLHQPQLVLHMSENDIEESIKASLGRLDLVVPEQSRYVSEISCLDGVRLLTVKQKTGVLCYIEVEGCTAAVSAGPVDCTTYPACNVFLAGRSVPKGLQTDIIMCADTVPEWSLDCKGIRLYSGEDPVLWLRPGKTVRVIGAVPVSENE